MIDGQLEGVWLAVLPLLISGAGTLAGAIFIGLPYTLVLHRLKAETLGRYVAGGAAAGFVAPLIFAAAFGFEGLLVGLMAAVFGLLSGVFAGSVWGEWRMSVPSEE